MFSLVSSSNLKIFYRVVRIAIDFHSCCTRVACVTFVSHLFCTDVAHVALVLHSCGSCCTCVARVWQSCCKIDQIRHFNKNTSTLVLSFHQQITLSLLHSFLIEWRNTFQRTEVDTCGYRSIFFRIFLPFEIVIAMK